MLSKNKIKFIKALQSKKNRENTGLFVAEGNKIVSELISSSLKINFIAATDQWFEQNVHLKIHNNIEKVIADKSELLQASLLKSPQNALCVVEIPQYILNIHELSNKLSIILDRVQDPGNLGTIIRIADWFGIENIICSKDSADNFNPKVVQSTMGAIARVKIHYMDLINLFTEVGINDILIFGTTLQGESIYNCVLPPNGFILLGNESKGINPDFQPYLSKQLFIPYFPDGQKRSESLNVAIAAAIVCSEFRRRTR